MNVSPAVSSRLVLVPEGARVGEALVRLTRSERALLGWLVAHAGEPQPADRLLREVWQYAPGVSSRTVVTTVNRLRTKLALLAGPRRMIRTVTGGYVFDPPEPGRSGEPALVGRETEAAEIGRWLRSSGSLLVVTGAPGVGKSALVARALPEPVCRIDLQEAALADALDALDAAPAGIVWLDDADPVLAGLGSALVSSGRRLVITCRYPIDHALGARLHLEPLPERATEQLLDRWLSTRFSGASPSRDERSRWVARAAGNPARLGRILWASEGGGVPPGPARHHTEDQEMRWGLAGLPAPALAVLRRMAAVPVPVDAEAVEAVLGQQDQRPILALLRARWLVAQADGCWSVPDPVRRSVETDPAGLEPLRQHVLARVYALAALGDAPAARAAWRRCAWGLVGWAIGRTDTPDDLAELVQHLDHHAQWAGLAFDSRPILRETLARLPEDGQRWWILRRIALAEVRHGSSPDDPEVERLLEESLALAEQEPLPALLLALLTWGVMLCRAGQLGRAVQIARRTVAVARAHRESWEECEAWMLEASCYLCAGDLEQATRCTRTAMAVHPNPELPWCHARSFGNILAEVGRDEEAEQVWRIAGDALRAAGRSSYAARFDLERLWTAVAGGTIAPEAALAPMGEHYDALLASLPAREAGEAALYLAGAELLCDRPDRALRWVERATVFRDRAPELRAIGAAAYACLGLPVRWDALPAPVPEADPRMEQLTDTFARIAAGETGVARGAADAFRIHPGRMFRVLVRVLDRCQPTAPLGTHSA